MKYEVIRPWHGVKAGDVVTFKKLHPALRANVRPLHGQAAELVPATPYTLTGDKKPAKADITKRLKELDIEFDGRKSAEELAELLPDGDPLKVATK